MRSSSDTVSVHPFRVNAGTMASWLESISKIIDDDVLTVMASSDAVLNSIHIASSIFHSSRAVLNGRARARDHSIETLRWLTGSRQVQKALELSSTRGVGSILILLLVKRSYFGEVHDELPEVLVGKWDGPEISGLIPLDPEKEIVFGGRNVITHLGIEDDDDEGLELAVLEKVALTDL